MLKIRNDWEKAIDIELIKRDMNRSDLADVLGISVPYLYDIISGNRKATEMRQKINEYLELDGEKYEKST